MWISLCTDFTSYNYSEDINRPLNSENFLNSQIEE